MFNKCIEVKNKCNLRLYVNITCTCKEERSQLNMENRKKIKIWIRTLSINHIKLLSKLPKILCILTPECNLLLTAKKN